MTPEQVRADQLAYGRERKEVAKTRRDAFRSPMWHALQQANEKGERKQ